MLVKLMRKRKEEKIDMREGMIDLPNYQTTKSNNFQHQILKNELNSKSLKTRNFEVISPEKNKKRQMNGE